jgi:hypothetical protein
VNDAHARSLGSRAQPRNGVIWTVERPA